MCARWKALPIARGGINVQGPTDLLQIPATNDILRLRRKSRLSEVKTKHAGDLHFLPMLPRSLMKIEL